MQLFRAVFKACVGEASDQEQAKWLEKVSQRHADHPAFGAPKQQGKARRDFFCVRHYAGEVRYSADGLVEKNADRLSRGLYDLLSGSSCGLTRACFPPKDDAIAGRVRTVGEEWRSQLGGLMQKVGRMSPLFKTSTRQSSSRVNFCLNIRHASSDSCSSNSCCRSASSADRRLHSDSASAVMRRISACIFSALL